MKIGLVNPYSIAKYGGVQNVVRSLSTELRKRGHETRIITSRPADFPDNSDYIFIGDGVDFAIKPLHTVGQISATRRQEINAILRNEKFDVLHFHEPWVPFVSAQILQVNASLPPNVRVRTVGTFHAKLPENFGARTLARMVRFYTRPTLRYLDQLTAVSPAAADHLRALTRRTVTIIPNSIDLAVFTPPRGTKPNDNFDVVYVGRLEPRKGVEYLIRAFHIVAGNLPNARLIIAGDGIDRQKLEDLVRELNLTKKVTFRGFVPDAEKVSLLQNCRAAVYPALFGESFGIVLIEAMAAGAVVLAGDNPGYAAVMRDSGADFTVNPRNLDAFAGKLTKILTNEKLRTGFRNWAKAEVKKYDHAHIAKQYTKIYELAE